MAPRRIRKTLTVIPRIRTPDALPDDPFVFETNGTRDACLLIHGSTGTASDLRELGHFLHSQGCTVHGLALPGHARRPVELGGLDWHHCYETVHATWRQLVLDHARVHVVGFSFGGSLALHLAAHEAVHNLIVLAPGLEVRIGPRDVIGATLGLMLPGTWLRDRLLWHVNLLRFFRVVRQELHRVRCPILIMHARDDYLVKPTSSIAIHDGVGSRDRRLVVLREGGHLLPWGIAYPRVWREIERWLGRYRDEG